MTNNKYGTNHSFGNQILTVLLGNMAVVVRVALDL